MIRFISCHDSLISVPVLLNSEVNNMGLICHVDLFPIPSGDSSDGSTDPKRRQDQSQSPPGRASTSALSPTPYSPGAQQYPYTYPAPQPPAPFSPGVSQPGAPLGNIPSVQGNNLPPQQQAQAQDHQFPPNQAPPNPTRSDEIVHYFNGTYPITEGSKQTDSLAGTTFVQAANLDYKGNKVLMFVFAVRTVPLVFYTLSQREVADALPLAIGSCGKGRRELHTTIPLFRPFLPCHGERWADPSLGRMLRWAIPCLFDKGVPRLASIDRPHKGASFSHPHFWERTCANCLKKNSICHTLAFG